MKFLKEIRKKTGHTQYRLGQLLGIEPIHNYYRYEREPSVKRVEFMHFLVKVWRLSGLSAEEFLKLIEREPLPASIKRGKKK